MNYYFYDDKDDFTQDARAVDYLDKDMDIREIYEISRTTTRLEDIAFQ